jgi:hypothetical protein
LHALRPNLMAHYDRYREQGRPPAEAMKAAAYAVWAQADDTTLGPRARPHHGRQHQAIRAGADGRALGPGGSTLDDLDAAVRREVADLADGVDPEVLDRLQRQWRVRGLVPPAEAAELLAAYARELPTYGAATAVAARLDALARQQRGAATRIAGNEDIEGTTVDEHHDALTRATVDHGAADLDVLQAAQAQRLSRAFPPPTVVQTQVPHLAGKQPAQIVTPVRQRGPLR